MCNLGMAVELKGMEKGMQQGIEQGRKQGEENKLLENIKSLMKTLNFTVQQAMDALQVPKEEQDYYAKKL